MRADEGRQGNCWMGVTGKNAKAMNDAKETGGIIGEINKIAGLRGQRCLRGYRIVFFDLETKPF
jgi:hypothetical protein